MKYYYIYILSCSDGRYYVGVTNNLERRIAEHEFGLDEESFTYSRRPVKLVYSEYFTDVRQAIAREKQVKDWSRKKKAALILNHQENLKQFSKRKSGVSRGTSKARDTST